MIRALIILAVLLIGGTARAADQATAPLSFVAGQARLSTPTVITGAPYNAKCDGTTDDAAAFDAASAALGAAGGGTILVPATGSPCRLGSDVLLRPNVTLRCEPGASFKSTTSSSFAFGAITTFQVTPVLQLSADNVQVEGCAFDLNARLGPAIYLNGTNVHAVRNVVTNGDTSEAADHYLMRLSCTGGTCSARANSITCASTSGAKDVGLYSHGAGAAELSGNLIAGCDSQGILIGGEATASTNSVSVPASASSGTGILCSSTSTCSVRGNSLSVAAGYGVQTITPANFPTITDNRFAVSGATAVAIQNDTTQATIANNRWNLTSSTAGANNDTAKGYVSTANGGSSTVVGNVGRVTTTDAQIHIEVGGAQTVVMGNMFTNGAYCAAPALNSGTINVNFSGNRCYNQSTAAVVGVTGWIVNGNYLAWLSSGGRTLVLAGDDRGTKKFSVDHLNVTGNIISSIQSGVSGIETAVVNKVCTSGSKVNEPCTNDNTTDCPSGTCPNCCVAQNFEGVQIIGNHFLFASGADPAIDLSTGVSSTGGDTWNWSISGNTFDMSPSNGVGIKFPSSNQTKVRNIQIGPNSYVGSSARLQDWSPNMGYDAHSIRYYLPVGSCDVTGTATLTPLWSIPGTTSATKGCRPASGSYRWGVLVFPNTADKEAMTQIGLTGDANQGYSAFVKLRFSFVTASSNTMQWVVRAHCAGPGDDPDFAAFSTENGVEAVYENEAGISNADALMATSYLKLPLPDGCFGGDLLQILVRRDTDDTTGTDNYANDVNLFDAEVVVSVNKMSN